MSGENLNWNKINFFWIDDRFVSHDHKDSNYKLFSDHFAQYAKDLNCYPIPFSNSINKCAIEYENTILENVELNSEEIPCFDLLLIGVGDDGHIASLFPNSEELRYNGKRHILTVLNSPLPHDRITFSLKVLNSPKKRIIGLKGAKKIKIFNEILSDTSNDYPIKHLLDSNSKDYWISCNI